MRNSGFSEYWGDKVLLPENNVDNNFLSHVLG